MKIWGCCKEYRMSVVVDDCPLQVDVLGLKTVGQVLHHITRDNRLVVQVLIDGQAPDLSRLSTIKQSSVEGKTIFIETAEPRRMAAEVLAEVAAHLDQADSLKSESAKLLQQGNHSKAMEKLGGCFTIWQHAQESVQKTAQLLRLDLSTLRVEARSLTEVLDDFRLQLKQIKQALENRDFVTLSDMLVYETTETSSQWRAALATLRDVVG